MILEILIGKKILCPKMRQSRKTLRHLGLERTGGGREFQISKNFLTSHKSNHFKNNNKEGGKNLLKGMKA